MGISTGGWAPVHVHDRDAMRGQLCGKDLQAQIHDTRASPEQLWQAGRYRDGRMRLLEAHSNACLRTPHRRSLHSVALGVYAKDRSGETYSLRVTVSQEQAVIA